LPDCIEDAECDDNNDSTVDTCEDGKCVNKEQDPSWIKDYGIIIAIGIIVIAVVIYLFMRK